MPRLVITSGAASWEELAEFLWQHALVEGALRIGPSFVVNVVGDEREWQTFQRELRELFPELSLRELCRGKCRDGSDCLNSAREGQHCWRHRT